MLHRLAIMVVFTVSIWTVTASIDTNERLVFACSCLGIKPQQEAFEVSQVVFAGKLDDLEVTNETYPNVIATFDIHTIWKGNITKDPLKLTTGMGGADCGYIFVENEEYLVYAFGEEGDLGTSSCTRTMPLDRAEADLVVLGQGDSTFAGERASFVGINVANFSYVFIGAVAAAGAVIAAILVWRQRESRSVR